LPTALRHCLSIKQFDSVLILWWWSSKVVDNFAIFASLREIILRKGAKPAKKILSATGLGHHQTIRFAQNRHFVPGTDLVFTARPVLAAAAG
jgi:hypothetical protein